MIDNSPHLPDSPVFKERFDGEAGLRYILQPEPGLSRARNTAIAESMTDIIAFLDDDAIASPAWLEEHRDAYEKGGDTVAAVGGRIDPIWDEARPTWLHDELLGYVSVVDLGGDEVRLLGDGEWIAGANMSFRIENLRAIGGFSEDLGRVGSTNSLLSNEETQVLETIQAGGGFTAYAPKAKVDHLVPTSRLNREWFRKRAAWQAVSDFMKEKREPSFYNKSRDYALGFLQTRPARHRNVSGLWEPVDDPDAFIEQIGAVYNFTIATLAGYEAS